jgi:hypothetical protein
MSYANPRPAKLKAEVNTRTITGNGMPTEGTRKAGEKCMVQRSPMDPGFFLIYFGKKSPTKQEYAKIPAESLPDTIQYTDGKPEGFNF